QNQQTIFYIDQLKPQWLHNRIQRWTSLIFIAFVTGLICGLTAGLAGIVDVELSIGLSVGGFAFGFAFQLGLLLQDRTVKPTLFYPVDESGSSFRMLVGPALRVGLKNGLIYGIWGVLMGLGYAISSERGNELGIGLKVGTIFGLVVALPHAVAAF